jgi:hypothetical protein
MAGLVPAIPFILAQSCHSNRDHRITTLTRLPGDDASSDGTRKCLLLADFWIQIWQG